MTDDIVTRLREQVDCSQQLMCYAPRRRLDRLSHEAADEIERLRAALLEIFDHECRTSDRSFIACTARDALWPRAALEGEQKNG